jgi:ATP adenylyltransferase
MAEFHKNVWAPWRMEYIDALQEEAQGCFFCHYRDNPQDDLKNQVLWRSDKSLVLLNRFPYTNGHVLIAPTAHVGEPEDLPDDVLLELTLRTRDVKRVLQTALHTHGFNIGMNLGRCAGAGLPDHLHWHVVPRWDGDTNFMPVLGDARVISQSLQMVHEKFLESAAQLGL